MHLIENLQYSRRFQGVLIEKTKFKVLNYRPSAFENTGDLEGGSKKVAQILPNPTPRTKDGRWVDVRTKDTSGRIEQEEEVAVCRSANCRIHRYRTQRQQKTLPIPVWHKIMALST